MVAEIKIDSSADSHFTIMSNLISNTNNGAFFHVKEDLFSKNGKAQQ